MKINAQGSSTANSLYHHTLFLLGLSPSDTTSFPTADFIRSANQKLRDAGFLFWKNSSMWEFDDENQTDLPIATTLLVAGQRDYSIPTTTFGIERVEVKDCNGDYQLLKQLDKSEINDHAMLEMFDSDGMPIYYDIMGNSIFLYPSPAAANVTLTAGLRVYVSRDMHEFALTDTSTEPGFPDVFHPIISYGCAEDYALSKNMNTQRLQVLQSGISRYNQMITDYAARRNRNKRVRIKPSTRSDI